MRFPVPSCTPNTSVIETTAVASSFTTLYAVPGRDGERAATEFQRQISHQALKPRVLFTRLPQLLSLQNSQVRVARQPVGEACGQMGISKAAFPPPPARTQESTVLNGTQ